MTDRSAIYKDLLNTHRRFFAWHFPQSKAGFSSGTSGTSGTSEISGSTGVWPDLGSEGLEKIRQATRASFEGMKALCQGDPDTIVWQLDSTFLERELSDFEDFPPLDRRLHWLEEGVIFRASPHEEFSDQVLTSRLQVVLTRLDHLEDLFPELDSDPPHLIAGTQHPNALAARLYGLLQSFQGMGDLLDQAGIPEKKETLQEAFDRLKAFADLLKEQKEAAPQPLGHKAYQELFEKATGRTLQPEQLLQALNADLETANSKLDKQAAHLANRYGQSNHANPREAILDELSQDHSRAEHFPLVARRWLSEFQQLFAICRFPLPAWPLENSISLGFARPSSPREMEGAPDTHSSFRISLPDLALLAPHERRNHLTDRNNLRLMILLLEEVFPGRAALLQSYCEKNSFRAFLLRPEDLDIWSSMAPKLAFKAGWMRNDPRSKLFQSHQEQRELLFAIADLKWHLELSSFENIRRFLREQGALPGHLVLGALHDIHEHPGRALSRYLGRLEAEKCLKRYKRRHGDDLGSADFFAAAQEISLMKHHQMAPYLGNRQTSNQEWQTLPSPIPDPKDKQDDLERALEVKLAAAGRIRAEDLDVGKEFDLDGGKELHLGTSTTPVQELPSSD